MAATELHADPERLRLPGTGIFVRAINPETKRWATFDLAQLDKPSLLAWLRGRGGDNPRAENTVGVLLGHGNLHSEN